MSGKCGNKSCDENWPGATAGSDEKKEKWNSFGHELKRSDDKTEKNKQSE